MVGIHELIYIVIVIYISVTLGTLIKFKEKNYIKGAWAIAPFLPFIALLAALILKDEDKEKRMLEKGKIRLKKIRTVFITYPMLVTFVGAFVNWKLKTQPVSKEVFGDVKSSLRKFYYELDSNAILN